MTGDMTPLRRLRMKHGMTQDDVARICNVTKGTISNWEIGRTNIDLENLALLAHHFGVSADYLLGKETEKKKEAPWVPVLGDVAAGIPITAVEDIGEDWEQIDVADPTEYFALRIKGNSMEPKISSGDVVIVHRQQMVEDGEIAVVKVNSEEATVKRVRITDNGVWLMPTNPSYDPMYYSVEQVRSLPVTIIGKVVELRAKF